MTQENIDQNPVCKIHWALVLRPRWLSEKGTNKKGINKNGYLIRNKRLVK
jgi:hypothetical protein